MNDTLYIRRATMADLPRLMTIFAAARSFMRSHGNLAQWTGGYPSLELVSQGISLGQQWVVCRRAVPPTAPSVRYETFIAPPSDSPVIPSEKRGFDEGSPAEIVATFWFSTAPEPTYARIFDGAWLSEKDMAMDERGREACQTKAKTSVSTPRTFFRRMPRGRMERSRALDGTPIKARVKYGVIHRLASDGSASGVGARVLRWALARCGDLRVDTHRDNSLMQSLLRHEGFTHCGTIFLADGSPRDAFERILSPSEAKKMVREQVREPTPISVLYEARTAIPPTAPSSASKPSLCPSDDFPSLLRRGVSAADGVVDPVLYETFAKSSLQERLSSARTVALFCALPDEPSVDFLFDKWLSTKRLALPVVIPPPASPPTSQQMVFREYTGPGCLRRGSFGILEPADTPIVPPGEIDVMFVPGVAYTIDNQRLGRGGGFYDRYLCGPAAAKIYKIGVCAPWALVEWLPTEEHDVKVDEILMLR